MKTLIERKRDEAGEWSDSPLYLVKPDTKVGSLKNALVADGVLVEPFDVNKMFDGLRSCDGYCVQGKGFYLQETGGAA